MQASPLSLEMSTSHWLSWGKQVATSTRFAWLVCFLASIGLGDKATREEIKAAKIQKETNND